MYNYTNFPTHPLLDPSLPTHPLLDPSLLTHPLLDPSLPTHTTPHPPQTLKSFPSPTDLALNEVTDNSVVEVVDGRPSDPLCHILLLLCLQRQLNEDLLKFLIHKIDTELLKPIFLQRETVIGQSVYTS